MKKALQSYKNISVVARATMWFVICSVLQKGVSLITTPIFTRMMSTEQYGQFGVYNSWLQIFTIFTTLRLNGAVFNKGMSLYKDDRDSYTSTMQIISLSLAVLCAILYLIFKDAFNGLTDFPTYIMIALFSELTVTPAIDFWTAKKRYEYQYKSVVFRTISMVVINAILGVIFVYYSQEKGYARILSCVLVNLCFGLILFISNLKNSKTWFKAEYARFAIVFNIPLLLHYLSQYILDQFDRIMVQKMVSMAAAGIYGVAYNVGLLLRIVTTSINSALVPWQYENLEKKEYKRLDDTMFAIFCFVAACSVLLICMAPEIMCVLADKKYYEGIYVIPPVAIGLFFSFVYTLYANIEFYYNANKFSMYISAVGAAINVVLNYIGIKIFGYIAAAYTTLICYVMFALGHYIYTMRCLRKADKNTEPFQRKRLVILSIGVIVFGLLISLTYEQALLRYCIILAVGAVLFWKRSVLLSTLKSIKKR